MREKLPELPEWVKRANRRVNKLLGTLFQIVIFVWGSTAIVHLARFRYGVGLPDFGLTAVQSSVVWGILFLPGYVVAMGAIAIVFAIGLFVLILLYAVVLRLHLIVGLALEIWRDVKQDGEK